MKRSYQGQAYKGGMSAHSTDEITEARVPGDQWGPSSPLSMAGIPVGPGVLSIPAEEQFCPRAPRRPPSSEQGPSDAVLSRAVSSPHLRQPRQHHQGEKYSHTPGRGCRKQMATGLSQRAKHAPMCLFPGASPAPGESHLPNE